MIEAPQQSRQITELIIRRPECDFDILEYSDIFFDVESTLNGLEGWPWLATHRSSEIQMAVASLTHQAMNGEISFEDALDERVRLVSPTKQELEHELFAAYADEVTPGAYQTVLTLQALGKRVYALSGGLLPAVYGATDRIGIPRDMVFANTPIFDANGICTGIFKDPEIPLWRPGGKRDMVAKLKRGKSMMVGDGVTDEEAITDPQDLFVHYTGIIGRPDISARASVVITDLRQVLRKR